MALSLFSISTAFLILQFVCTVIICRYSQSLVNDDGNSWRGIIYEKLSPAAKLPQRGLNDALQAATQAAAQGNSVASEALSAASQIVTAAQSMASEAISKLSLEVGAGVSKVCVVEGGKSTCADYASEAAANDLKRVADMLSDAGGGKALETIASTLSNFNVGAIMSYTLLITITSLIAYLVSVWPLHGVRTLMLSALTLLGVLVTGCMLAVVLVIVYLRSKASSSGGSLEGSPCLADAVICFVGSAVKSAATLAELRRAGTEAVSPPSASAAGVSSASAAD